MDKNAIMTKNKVMANIKDKNLKEEKNKQIEEQETALCTDCVDCDCGSGYDTGFLYPFWSDLFWERPLRREMGNLQNLMRTDIEETANGYEFKIEIPGVERKDISISFENGYLAVGVNKVGNSVTGQSKYLRRERVASACSRSFYVGDIDKGQISATLGDGVLTVVVPKEIKSQRYQIEIK